MAIIISACEKEKKVDFWYLEADNIKYHFCIPDDNIGCKSTMTIDEAYDKGMIAVTSDGFKELTKQYNDLKRRCDN